MTSSTHAGTGATGTAGPPLVTIAIPVYKRLQYLPGALRAVASQDYPNIELIVSDNGLNGGTVRDIVDSNYPGPWRFRQNPSIETVVTHWNNIIADASGDYFALLADDDEISPNYVSELTALLERHPHASVAIAGQEILDESGAVVRRSKAPLPERVTGPEFIRAVFHTYEYRFECFMTTFSRTADLRRCGGYPDFFMATHADDVLLLKLSLGRDVVLNHRCAFRYRIYEASYGLSMTIEEIARAFAQLLAFLDSDPQLRDFARAHPETWKELRGYLVKNKWQTHHSRWRTMYRNRLTRLQWLRAAFTLPFIPAYYARVASTLLETGKYSVADRAKVLARRLRNR
ncbi:MAG: glycosyltransferase family A protein [Candidatus Rokuibacteriota bacterium]